MRTLQGFLEAALVEVVVSGEVTPMEPAGRFLRVIKTRVARATNGGVGVVLLRHYIGAWGSPII